MSGFARLSLESLDERLNLSPVVPTNAASFPGEARAVVELSVIVYTSRLVGGPTDNFDSSKPGASEAPVPLEGDQTLVFFLGGIPARSETIVADDSVKAPDGQKYKLLVAPLIIDLDASNASQVRNRFFAIVDRTQLSTVSKDETITIHGNRTEVARSNVFAVWVTVGQ